MFQKMFKGMVFRPLIPSRYNKLDVVQFTCRLKKYSIKHCGVTHVQNASYYITVTVDVVDGVVVVSLLDHRISIRCDRYCGC